MIKKIQKDASCLSVETAGDLSRVAEFVASEDQE